MREVQRTKTRSVEQGSEVSDMFRVSRANASDGIHAQYTKDASANNGRIVPVSSVLEEVVDFCRQNLDINAEASEYLFKQRGLSREIAERFKIGYCPSDLSALYKRVSPRELREIGFIRDAQVSQFPNRIIFPVWNQYGELVAVAGRILPKYFTGIKKYYNSLYAKSRVLFGMNFALKSIKETSEVLVTEGHLDVITSHEYGLTNVVGTCGTAFTFEHMMLLSRYAKKVRLLFDADKAGIKATKRVLETEYPGVEVDSVSIDNGKGKDLDSYLREDGIEALKGLLRNDFFCKIRAKLV